jgi:hypothetical protein
VKRTDKTTAGFGGATVALEGGYRPGPPAPPTPLVAPAPTKRPRGTNVMRVAKIDPEKRIAAIVPIRADMRSIRRMVGSQHVGEQLATSFKGHNIMVCCAQVVSEGKVWRIRGGLPFRGRAILYGYPEHGPADFPADAAWLKNMIQFDPEGIERAFNDPRPLPAPSPEQIQAAKTPGGGWTRTQLAAWGVPWPPAKGWRKDLEARHERGKADAAEPSA